LKKLKKKKLHPVDSEVVNAQDMLRNLEVNKEGHVDQPLHETLIKTSIFYGVPGCQYCGGEGKILTMERKKFKACRDCVIATGNCICCQNTGLRMDDTTKKCNCKFGKEEKTVKYILKLT